MHARLDEMTEAFIARGESDKIVATETILTITLAIHGWVEDRRVREELMLRIAWLCAKLEVDPKDVDGLLRAMRADARDSRR